MGFWGTRITPPPEPACGCCIPCGPIAGSIHRLCHHARAAQRDRVMHSVNEGHRGPGLLAHRIAGMSTGLAWQWRSAVALHHHASPCGCLSCWRNPYRACGGPRSSSGQWCPQTHALPDACSSHRTWGTDPQRLDMHPPADRVLPACMAPCRRLRPAETFGTHLRKTDKSASR
jgi:hypothetical protein